jgi:hypothetical protein
MSSLLVISLYFDLLRKGIDAIGKLFEKNKFK